MRITTQAWETYIRRLAQLNEKAAQLMAEYLAAHGTADTEALTDYAAALVQKYGEGSAELACQMYDAMAALQNARVSPAEPAAPASRREVARMVLATRESPPQMQRGVSRLVKRAGADTTLKNAQRDGAEFAWVPHGDSCAFCLTLASRGWQRASQAAIKGGQRNSPAELLKVAQAVMSGAVKYCPHGRPVAIELTRQQLEKRFGRA